MFEAMNVVLRTHPEVGEYNQKIWGAGASRARRVSNIQSSYPRRRYPVRRGFSILSWRLRNTGSSAFADD